MAVNEKQVLDLSASGIKKLEKRDGVGIISLIVDNNELTKLENLECFPDLEKLSASGNAIVRMYHVSKCHHITHLNLPNNNLVCIEGLKELPNLVFLNLSVNNIKSIQNLQHSSALAHLDLSRNNISNLSDISNLTKLKTLHLNGNKISTLNRASAYLPAGICTLSLADNCIADLNEISYLVKLLNLEQLTISGNPCLSTDELSLPSFDYRPFVINWSLGLRLLDGRVASQKESLKAEWLYSQGKGRHYKPGEHVELIEYLCQVCPVTADQQSTDEEDEKLSHILHMQRKHKEEFLNKMSQSLHIQSTEVSRPDDINPMAQSYHFKTETSGKSNDAEMTLPSNVVPSKIMYESAPEVLFHCTTTEPAQIPPPSFQSGKYPRSVSKSEILHSSIKSPITIEQVSVEMDSSTKPKAPETTKSPYQYYEDRRVRPSSASETKTHTPKGTLIRKVSKRATSPSAAPLAPGRSKLPHSTSSKSRISPSKSCILTARLSAAAAKNSSESDTSEELGHSNRTPQRSFRSLSTDTQSGTNSPVLHQKYAPAALSPTKRVFGLSAKVQENQIPDDMSKRPFPPIVTKSMTMSEIYGKSEEDIIKAAIKIQSTWRGYFVRNHNPRVCKLLQEIRFRRLEDHIQHLHGHLCRLTDFVLRQQQDLHHERELRKRQSEDIRHLHEQARDLQKSVTTALAKAKLNVFQSVSEHDISSKDSPREGSLPDSKFEKMLPGQSSESLNLALRYSTQAFQENSGLYSPSSQTSSVTSSVPDTTFSQPKSRRDLQPSASDVSDADSGMQSMVSPNVGNVDSERNTHSTDVDHSLLNGYANENSSYASYKRSPNDCAYQRNVKPINQPSERESDYDETIRSKLNMYQSKNMSSVKHSVPLASVSSSGEESWNLQHAHDIGYINSNKYGIPSRKMSYVEFSNSSVESSPCSAFASEDCDNPLTRTINEAHVLSRQHFPPNHMSQVKLEEIGKHKSIDGSSSVDYVHEKEHQGLDSSSVCCSKAGGSQQARDKLHLHYQRCTKSCSQCSCKHSGKICESNDPCNYKTCSVLSKRLNQFAQSKVTTPLEDIDSPQSPCTVEMSGRISHSCSFQSDGFTAAEELSATATVKVFSTRAVSMTCTNGAISPQTSSQRPISLSDASPQANLRSPLVLAANVWDKKVQDIESTFHQLQTQIRDLEGTFGQIGQLGQFFYPAILQDDSKESRPALHCAEPSSGALALDMPKINFKRTDTGNNDLLFQTRFPSNVPFLPHSSVSQHQPVIQNISDCRVEEIVQEVQPLHEEAKPTISDNQDIGKSMN